MFFACIIVSNRIERDTFAFIQMDLNAISAQHTYAHMARRDDTYLCWHVIEYLSKFNSISS